MQRNSRVGRAGRVVESSLETQHLQPAWFCVCCATGGSIQLALLVHRSQCLAIGIILPRVSVSTVHRSRLRRRPRVNAFFAKKAQLRTYFSEVHNGNCSPMKSESLHIKTQSAPVRLTGRPALTTRLRSATARQAVQSVRGGFTLLELLIVVGIIALLLVLTAPAFTYIKGGTDVTSAAYTIKGVLDTARTYAKANNTYTWVGFYEENVANPSSPNADTPAVGRIIMSIVASKDGTTVYDPNNLTTIDATKLVQVGKLTKVENAHLCTHTDTPTGTGLDFPSRP